MWRKVALLIVVCGFYTSARATVLLDDDFTGASVNTGVWNVAQPASASVTTTGGTNVEITNANPNGANWGTNAGIWTGQLFTRPTQPGQEVDISFLGVQLPNAQQRLAFGLDSYNAAGGQSTFALPDGDGNNDHLSYSFWLRPDTSYNQNWIRTKTVNQSAAASGGNGEHLWPFGQVMDFQIRVTSNDVYWYSRVEPSTTWTLVNDPFGSNNATSFDGTEAGGRSTFGVFAMDSSAGATDGVTWSNGDVKINEISVATNFDVPEPASITAMAGAACGLFLRRRKMRSL